MLIAQEGGGRLSTALKTVNPFREGAAGKYFVGREEALDRFARALTAL